MGSAFAKEVVRAVTGSLGRFLAIAAIVALGCGFYAGLRMAGPDMRTAGDAFLDGTDFYDLEVVSSAGIDQQALDQIRGTDGVQGVDAVTSADVMAQVGQDQTATRVQTVSPAAQTSSREGAFDVASDDADFLNRPLLASGRWPSAPDECVVSTDRASAHPVQVGEKLRVLYGVQDVDQVLSQKEFTVVGTVHSPEFMSSIEMGPTSLGDGSVEQLALVPDDAFRPEVPATQAYVKVAGAQRSMTDADGYEEAVAPVRQALSAQTGQWADAAAARLRSQAAEQARAQALSGQAQAQGQPGEPEDAASAQAAQGEAGDAAAGQAVEQAAEQAAAQVPQPTVSVLDRSKNYGVSSFEDDSRRVDNIASVFPLVFFLVAALVALTSMTRMVDDDRAAIGTLKALGYGRVAIASKYVLYALAASCAGALLGVAALTQLLPWIICRAYAIVYNVPQAPLPLPVDPAIAWSSAGLGVGMTLAATLAAVHGALRESPSQLVVPEAPAPGKRILLERTGALWSRLSFSWKVTWRNVFRYKRRMLMTVVGVAGCTALLLTGFGLHNSIWDIVDKQFGDILRYNATVQLADGSGDDALDQARGLLEGQGKATGVQAAHRQNMQTSTAGHDAVSVEALVPDDPAEWGSVVDLRHMDGGEGIAMDDDSVVLTQKAADELGVGPGDAVEVQELGATGEAQGQKHALTVTDVAEYYVGNAVFVGPGAWKAAMGSPAASNALFATGVVGGDARDGLTEALHDSPGVSTVSYTDETVGTYRTMLSSVNAIVVVLVVSAGLLAFIVLFDITKINVEERRREIASLKVLGFTRREVDAYVFREILVLVVVGAAVGLVLGVWLEGFVVVSAEVDYVMFGRAIHASSFVLAFLVTLAFAVAVMAAMRPQLRRVDMVESLKSVD